MSTSGGITDYDLFGAVDDLTDDPCSFAARHRTLDLVRKLGPNGAFRVADQIDQMCIYTCGAGLMAGSSCGLEDWHEFAKELRGSWETYG